MSLTFRHAVMQDAEVLFSWRNHPDTYRWFRVASPVTWEEHVRWLERKIWSILDCLMIAEMDGLLLGVVRFDGELRSDETITAEISITIAPNHRGAGHGAAVLREATRMALDTLGYSRVEARVHSENVASLRAFTAAGYRDEGTRNGEWVMLVAGRA